MKKEKTLKRYYFNKWMDQSLPENFLIQIRRHEKKRVFLQSNKEEKKTNNNPMMEKKWRKSPTYGGKSNWLTVNNFLLLF